MGDGGYRPLELPQVTTALSLIGARAWIDQLSGLNPWACRRFPTQQQLFDFLDRGEMKSNVKSEFTTKKHSSSLTATAGHGPKKSTASYLKQLHPFSIELAAEIDTLDHLPAVALAAPHDTTHHKTNHPSKRKRPRAGTPERQPNDTINNKDTDRKQKQKQQQLEDDNVIVISSSNSDDESLAVLSEGSRHVSAASSSHSDFEDFLNMDMELEQDEQQQLLRFGNVHEGERLRKASKQTRFFLALNYEAVFHFCSLFPHAQQHLYEIIREGSPCHLYLDVEFEPSGEAPPSKAETLNAMTEKTLDEAHPKTGTTEMTGRTDATDAGRRGILADDVDLRCCPKCCNLQHDPSRTQEVLMRELQQYVSAILPGEQIDLFQSMILDSVPTVHKHSQHYILALKDGSYFADNIQVGLLVTGFVESMYERATIFGDEEIHRALFYHVKQQETEECATEAERCLAERTTKRRRKKEKTKKKPTAQAAPTPDTAAEDCGQMSEASSEGCFSVDTEGDGDLDAEDFEGVVFLDSPKRKQKKKHNKEKQQRKEERARRKQEKREAAAADPLAPYSVCTFPDGSYVVARGQQPTPQSRLLKKHPWGKNEVACTSRPPSQYHLLKCVVDLAVYSRNRMFRCVGSCKLGKTAVLMPNEAFLQQYGQRLYAETSRTSGAISVGSYWHRVLLSSMVTVLDPSETMSCILRQQASASVSTTTAVGSAGEQQFSDIGEVDDPVHRFMQIGALDEGSTSARGELAAARPKHKGTVIRLMAQGSSAAAGATTGTAPSVAMSAMVSRLSRSSPFGGGAVHSGSAAVFHQPLDEFILGEADKPFEEEREEHRSKGLSTPARAKSTIARVMTLPGTAAGTSGIGGIGAGGVPLGVTASGGGTTGTGTASISQVRYVLYVIGNTRYCHNVQREHKSNSVYYVVDLWKGQFHQKCYDPDCRGFSTGSMKVPGGLIPAEHLPPNPTVECASNIRGTVVTSSSSLGCLNRPRPKPKRTIIRPIASSSTEAPHQ